MNEITTILKEKYYQFNPGEFLPVYSDGRLANRREFHLYRMKQIVGHPAAAYEYFTHYGNRC